MAHLRLKFHEAAKGSKRTGGPLIGLSKIQKIYRAEEELRALNMDESSFLNARQEKVKPLLKDFKIWLDGTAIQVRPSSTFGRAISYACGEWSNVVRYLDSASLTPDNHATEGSIKPFVLGRGNWLFSGSPRGADASSFCYSMIETAKVNNLNPYGYLKGVLETSPNLKPFKYEDLLPWNCDRDLMNRYYGQRN